MILSCSLVLPWYASSYSTTTMLVIVMMHDGNDSIRTSGEPQDTIAMVIVMLVPRVVVEYTMVCHGKLCSSSSGFPVQGAMSSFPCFGIYLFYTQYSLPLNKVLVVCERFNGHTPG